MPWDIVVRTVTSLVVAGGAGVAVGGVDVAVTTGGGVDIDGWVDSQWVNTVFGEQPIGFNKRHEEDTGAVRTDHIGTGVRFGVTGFDHEGSRDLSEEFSGFHIADLKRVLGCHDFFPNEEFTGVKGVPNWQNHGFA